MTIPIIYAPGHVQHRPRTEIFYGKPGPHPDQPERVESIRRALRSTRWEQAIIPPAVYPLVLAELTHDTAYVAHLRQRCAEMAARGAEQEWFPYVWPRDRAMDTGTPLLGATFDVAWISACIALTAADLALSGAEAVFGLCRPPGHHASRGMMGGYCYLNNAALAAVRLLGGVPHGRGVAILDLDVHHGNGTQDIFYETDRALYCSIHGDPAWAYPPHTGFAEETGASAGTGYTYNQPLPQGTGWPVYADALERSLDRIAAFDPAYIVLSQGFDTFEGDRWGGFTLHVKDYTAIGARLRALGVPIVALLEGGYEPPNLAAGTLALLEGLETGRRPPSAAPSTQG